MGYFSTFLKSPKKEEQQVPDTNTSSDSKEGYAPEEEVELEDEFEGILGKEDEENHLYMDNGNMGGQLCWDLMDWEEDLTPCFEDQENDYYYYYNDYEGSSINKVVKSENVGFWELEDENKASTLNLNLNYQEVLDAWSDRGPLLADDFSLSVASSGYYMGEVPVMEEERTRREASVLRYREKRQSRLFSKKIRYQVRKLNADKRPRLKGRFVKRVS